MMRFHAARRTTAALLALLVAAIPAAAEMHSAEALLEDFDCLQAVIREEYPFLPVLARRGIDAEALFAGTRALIAGGDGDIGRFYGAVEDMFFRMDNFAHLAWIGPESYRACAAMAEEGLFAEADAALFADGKTRAAYAALGFSEAAADPPEIEADYFPEQAAVRLRVRSFDHARIGRDRRAVADALEEYPGARNIIFDITGNRGGSDYYWSAVLVAPFGETRSHEIVTWLKPTPLNLKRVDAGALLRAEDMPPESVPAFVRELGLTHCVVHTETAPFEPCDGPAVGEGVRRWVLIDGGAFSAADGFASFCKATGWAVLVGEATMGCGADGFAPLISRLPNTGLLFRFDGSAAANDDGSLNAETGTRPDFCPKPRETPLDACLRLIDAGAGR